jgi:hypothetical protein
MMKNLIILLIAAIALIGVAASIDSSNPVKKLLDNQAERSEMGSVLSGGSGSDWTSAQDQLSGSKSSKLRCSILTNNNIYMTGDRINSYYWISKDCYVKIVIDRPDGKFTILDPTWTKAGKYSIPGIAKKPFGDRTVSLKAWTDTSHSGPPEKSSFFNGI